MSERMTGEISFVGAAHAIRQRIEVGAEVAAMGLVSVLLLTGCSSDTQGIVMQGADGQTYEMPEGAERPVYRTKQDCVEDVRDQINALNEEGAGITEAPEDLCEDTATYARSHGGTSVLLYRGGYWGPILPGNSRWDSPRVIGWEPVSNGLFAAPGAKVQSGITRAPAGSKVGGKTSIRGGFGSSGKGGFGHGVAS